MSKAEERAVSSFSVSGSYRCCQSSNNGEDKADTHFLWGWDSMGSDQYQGEGMKTPCHYVLDIVLYVGEQVYLKFLSNWNTSDCHIWFTLWRKVCWQFDVERGLLMLITRTSYSQPENSPKKANITSPLHDHLKRISLLPPPKSLSHPQLSSIPSFHSPSGLSDMHINQAYHSGELFS